MRNAVNYINRHARAAAACITLAAAGAGVAVGFTDNPLRDLIAQLPARILSVIA